MFDRDDHVAVDTAAEQAIRNGVRLAFSHPCFELWLLLHFQSFATPLGGRCRSLASKLCQHEGFKHFRKHLGREEWEALHGRSEAARIRALQLIKGCPSVGCGPLDHAAHCIPTSRDPSTDVWKLLDSLELRY